MLESLLGPYVYGSYHIAEDENKSIPDVVRFVVGSNWFSRQESISACHAELMSWRGGFVQISARPFRTKQPDAAAFLHKLQGMQHE